MAHLVSTYWSCAQKNGRETEASGIGWELFKNFLIAKEKFKPDYFLYENNKSAAQAIKDQIARELEVPEHIDMLSYDNGHRLTYINSALVSGQNRQRFYVTNFGDIEQPADRGILLRDILDSASEPVNITEDGKSQAIKAEPVRVGTLPNADGIAKDSQATRIYSIEGKAVTQTSGGGGQGAKTGLYAVPTDKPIYAVKDGQITIKGKQYPIKLLDGYYMIRKLTVNECRKLQTVPDWYAFPVSSTQAYKMLGNSWTVEVIKHLFKKALGDTKEPLVVLSMYDGMSAGQIALRELGYNIHKYYATEIDKYCIQTTHANFPDTIQLGDAFQVRESGWHIE